MAIRGDGDHVNRKQKISKSLAAIASIGMLLIFDGIFSEGGSITWGEKGKIVNDSFTTPSPIIISNGKILSRGLILDPSLLLAAKQAVQNYNNTDPTLQASIEQLLFQANSFLSLRPTSVIEKSEVPASGDKHDFLSLAPYRWPDPTRPVGLPY